MATTTTSKTLYINVQTFNGKIGLNINSPTGDFTVEWTKEEWENLITTLRTWKEQLKG